jgi:hypothetical protein
VWSNDGALTIQRVKGGGIIQAVLSDAAGDVIAVTTQSATTDAVPFGATYITKYSGANGEVRWTKAVFGSANEYHRACGGETGRRRIRYCVISAF